VLVTFRAVSANPKVLTQLILGLAAKDYSVCIAVGVTTSPVYFAVDHEAVALEEFRP
jgi:hypothetical protein